MTYRFHPGSTSALKDKVVVLTGGALGVGAQVVRQAHAAGAHVFFGDVLDDAGTSLASSLSSSPKQEVKYIHCDVTSYSDTVRLFETAYATCGRVDHAIANAGIGEQGNIIDPNLTMETVREEPARAMRVLDVNLKGEIYFARVAAVYLRQSAEGIEKEQAKQDKSLTLVSSVAGFREDPGLHLQVTLSYVPAKHGVMGLMRALREPLSRSQPFAIRTNAICPWMTKTRLVTGLEEVWEKEGLPANTADDVARVIIGVACATDLNGGAMYIEGGRAWNIEAGILATRPHWLGVEQEKAMDRGTELMGGGEHWTAAQK